MLLLLLLWLERWQPSCIAEAPPSLAAAARSTGSALGLVGGVIHSPAGLGIPLSLPDSVWSGLFPSGGNGDGTSALSHQASLYSVIISHIK